MVTDGHVTVPSRILAPDASPQEWSHIEARSRGHGGSIEAAVNIPVVRSGADLIVIDVGGGGRYQNTEGRLPVSLAEAGIDPLAVTKVALTHAHPDHLWGALGRDGQLRFPNATFHISPREWDFWWNLDVNSTVLSPLVPYAIGARRVFDAIRDRVVMAHPGTEVAAGLQAVDTPGHTPGHLAFVLHGREPLLFAGDAFTNEIVSVERPTWRYGNDADPDQAVRTRMRLIDELARGGSMLMAAHFAHPGLGVIERVGEQARFEPLGRS